MKYLLQILTKLGIIKSKREEIVARPRKLKYGNGEILLYNYSPEEADAIQEKLLESAKELTSLPQAGDLVNLEKTEILETVDTTTLSHTALDLYQDPVTKDYKVVQVNYNPISRSAKVVEFLPAGSFKAAGVAAFKMELYKQGKV